MDVFSACTKILMSADSISTVFGKLNRVFIVTDGFMAQSGKISYVTDQMDKDGTAYQIFSDVTPDPDISIITEGVSRIAEFHPDAVIAFGGGSPIDAAKAIMYFAAKTAAIKDCPLIAIPTTSGTGSEVTKFSVISDNQKHIKYPLIDDSLQPDAAILDAKLIVSVPPAVTADTGIDVLTHAIEAYVSKHANDFSDAAAEKAIKLVYKYLLTAYKEPENLEARQGMHNASCLAGIAFSNVSLGLNHGMAHILGARCKLPHGRANGILLPYVMTYNAGCSSKLTDAAVRYAEIARMLGLESSSTRQSALNMIRTVRRFISELNVPGSIQQAGVDEKEFFGMIKEISKIALEDSCTATNPTPVTAENIEQIFKQAYYGKLV